MPWKMSPFFGTRKKFIIFGKSVSVIFDSFSVCFKKNPYCYFKFNEIIQKTVVAFGFEKVTISH